MARLQRGSALTEPPARRRTDARELSRRAKALIAAALAVALLSLAAAGYLLATRTSAADDRDAALSAARQYAVDLTTYDFATVDADVARFARHGTKEFQASYAKSIATVKPGIVKEQRRALGTVVAAGLESFRSDRATVLLAVDQEIRSAAGGGSSVDRSRIRMTLVHAGDGWLVSDVKVV
jgi:Mce-associated membrane protein